jgi:hypothetical protein
MSVAGAPATHWLLGASPLGGDIGVAYLPDTRIGSRRLSTHFQFEDRIGIGVTATRRCAFLCYAHYSKASIMQPNDRIDEPTLTVGRSLQ